MWTEFWHPTRLIGSFVLFNAGTLVKPAGPFAAEVAADIRNAGSVRVTSGRLVLTNSGATPHAGTFAVAAGAELQFDGEGTNSFTAPSPLTGAGTVVVGGACTVNLTGAIGVRRFKLVGGTTNVGTALTADLFAVTAGTANGTGRVTIPAGGLFQLPGGMVTGPLGLSIERDARLEWGSGSNGVMGGTGTTTIAPGASLALLGGRLRDTRTVRNQGTATFTGDLLDEGGRFINEGTILLAGDVGFPVHGGTGTLTNTTSGTIRKTAGTGTSWLTNLTNQGNVDVASGLVTVASYMSCLKTL